MAMMENPLPGPVPDPIPDHGGDLAAAMARFPDAPRPWIDLSTGISPVPYPLPPLPASAWTRLPASGDEDALLQAAARAYQAPSPQALVAAPGTQVLLPWVMRLVAPGRAVILSPTYAEHARAARLGGHRVSETGDFECLFDADLAVVVNPNNPDGRIVAREALLDLARHLRSRGGLLVVDEAFMDVGPRDQAMAGEVARGAVVVLRSFGKFFGLAGLRLGFAIGDAAIARRLRGQLGPWATSGPALRIGALALGDLDWQARARDALSRRAAGLDALLTAGAIPVAGGTSLFRYAEVSHAGRTADLLASEGILVRRFAFRDDRLRFGLPSSSSDAARLATALAAISQSGSEPAQPVSPRADQRE